MNNTSANSTTTESSREPAPTWRVDIEEHGRSGRVHYREATGTLSFWWEFGGNDVVAMIAVGNPMAWRDEHPWATDRRAEILRRIAAEAIRQKAPACRADIDDAGGWIYLRTGSPLRTTMGSASTGRTNAPKVSRMHILVLVSVAALVIVAAALALTNFMKVKTTGTPYGDSVRTPEHIATLVQTLEPYVPTLNRNPANDRTRSRCICSRSTGAHREG